MCRGRVVADGAEGSGVEQWFGLYQRKLGTELCVESNWRFGRPSSFQHQVYTFESSDKSLSNYSLTLRRCINHFISTTRFGIGRFTTFEEVDYTAENTIRQVKRLRDMRYTFVDYRTNVYFKCDVKKKKRTYSRNICITLALIYIY